MIAFLATKPNYHRLPDQNLFRTIRPLVSLPRHAAEDTVHFGNNLPGAVTKYRSDRVSPAEIDNFTPYRIEDLVEAINKEDLEKIKNAPSIRERVLAVVEALDQPLGMIAQRAQLGEDFRLTSVENTRQAAVALAGELTTKAEQVISETVTQAAMFQLTLRYADVFHSTKKGFVVTKRHVSASRSIYFQAWEYLKRLVSTSEVGDPFPSVDECLERLNLRASEKSRITFDGLYRNLIQNGYIQPSNAAAWVQKSNGHSPEGLKWFNVPFEVRNNQGLTHNPFMRIDLVQNPNSTRKIAIPDQLTGLILRLAQILQTTQGKSKRPLIFSATQMAAILKFNTRSFWRALRHPDLASPKGEPLFIVTGAGTYVNPNYPKIDDAVFKRVLGPDWKDRMDETTGEIAVIRKFLDTRASTNSLP